MEAYAHQDLPFEKLIEELKPERSLSHSPLVQVMFDVETNPLASFELPGLSINALPAELEFAKFDLELTVSNAAPGMTASLKYNTDLFDSDTATRMLRHFEVLLTAIITDPDRRISELQFLTSSERRQLAVEWNDTEAALPTSTLHELFEHQVRETPEATALIFEDVVISYRDLNERANRLAHHLVSLGVRPEVRVGVLLERSPELVVGLLGIFKAGGAYLPLDPSYPQQRLAFMLEDAAPQVVLTTRALLEKLPAQAMQTVCLDTDEQLISSRSCANLCGSASAENLAYLIYTSGSTGQPKAVQVEHRQLVNTLAGGKLSFSFNPLDSMPVIASFSFDISLFELLTPLISGATARVLTKQHVLDMPRLLDSLQEVTLLHTVPSLMQQILRSLEESEASARFDNLRAIFIGGEAVPPQLLHKMREVFAAARIHVLYGPTEASIICTSFTFDEELQTAQPLIGRPLSNVRIELRDKQGQLVPVGVIGELYIGGAGVARGYRNRPELNAERFVTIEGARFYRTGDLARYWADGNIEFLGRDDNQVKVRGYRIELSEVEVTMTKHPLVREAIVIATDDVSGNKSLVAYIVADRQPGGSDQPAAQATGNDEFAQSLPSVTEGEPERLVAQIRDYLRVSLPEHMMPAAFLVLDEIPLTPNGKVDRGALPLPERAFRSLERDYQPPRDPTEELLANIWAQVLGVERVGINHNFFELGGHSLLATQIISRVRRALRVDVPLRALFESPTVAGLAQHLAALRRVEAGLEPTPILPGARGERLSLSFAQQRLWFLDQLEQSSATYNLPYAGRLAGALNKSALERSVAEIIRRHEALRTSFVEVDDQPVQLIARPAPFEIPLIDLSDLPAAEREAVAQQLVAEEAARPFDLAKSPLLRLRLIRLAERENILTLTIHHIISDGWSMGLFFSELGALYAAYTEDRQSPLAELAIQYADFAAWQRRWLRDETLERQLKYWQAQLAGAPATLELPTDRPRPALQSYRGATESFALSQELSTKLASFSRSESVTLFMTLLAAFNTLLARYSGQKEIVVGTPVAGRNHAEIENLIGFFVNTLVLRTSLDDNPTFRSLVRRVRDVALGAYAHQDMAFEKLVEDLQPARDLSRAPLFQVMFALQNAPSTTMEFAGLKLTPLEAQNRTAKFDLTLYLTTDAASIKGSIEYNTDLFDAATIRRMIGHFQRLLESAIANPETSIFDLPLLAEAEQRQLLVEWNDTEQDYDRHACLHHLFEAQVSRTPDAVALYFDGQQLTYAELNARANQLARHLQTLGVGVESCVALLMHRSIELVVALLAILKAGAAYLPLDPELPEQRIAFMLSDAAAQLLITQAQFATSVAAYHLPVVVADAERSGWARYATANVASPVSAANACYVIYTSGSTGQPKGVVNLHTSLVNRLGWMQRTYPLAAADCVLQKTPVTFDVSGWEFFWPLMVGARLVVAVPGGHRDAAYLVQTIQAQAVTTLHFVPSMLEVFLHAAGVEHCRSLRRVICSGEALTVQLQARFFARLGAAALENLYGPTEAAIDVTSWSCARAGAPREVPIGHPLANTQVYVLDEGHRPVAVGVVGELYLGGVGLARGYLKRPDLTAERFVPDPFATAGGRRLYRTGDLARYRADGNAPLRGACRPAGQVARHARGTGRNRSGSLRSPAGADLRRHGHRSNERGPATGGLPLCGCWRRRISQ